jgi:hypothetical protein
MSVLPLEAAIAREDDLRPDVAAGLELLARSPALWPIGAGAWSEVLACVRGFAERWDAQARAAGWSTPELYSLHRRAPYANLAAMGAAFVVARSGHRVVAVDETIMLRSATGAVSRIRRVEAQADAVLAWSVTAAGIEGRRRRG